MAKKVNGPDTNAGSTSWQIVNEQTHGGSLVNTGTISGSEPDAASPAAASDWVTAAAGNVVFGTQNRFDALPAEVRAAVNSTGVIQTGSGLTVGVMSNSFDALGGAALDELDGALA